MKILQELGYSNITDSGDFYRMRPIYRESSSSSVLSVHKRKGFFVDFSKQIKGNFSELIRLSLGLSSIEEAEAWLSKKDKLVTRVHDKEIEIENIKYWNKSSFDKMVKDHSYWLNRGISESTLEQFRGGIVKVGKMKDRYTFPIFDSKDRIVGVSGRYINNITDQSNVPK